MQALNGRLVADSGVELVAAEEIIGVVLHSVEKGFARRPRLSSQRPRADHAIPTLAARLVEV